jgi:translation initiation factor IF-2
MRLGQIARKLNVGIATIVESMAKKGFEVENNPNSKISMDQYSVLAKEFKSSAQEKEEASHLSIGKRHHESFTIEADSDAREEPKPVPVKEEKKVEVNFIIIDPVVYNDMITELGRLRRNQFKL